MECTRNEYHCNIFGSADCPNEARVNGGSSCDSLKVDAYLQIAWFYFALIPTSHATVACAVVVFRFQCVSKFRVFKILINEYFRTMHYCVKLCVRKMCVVK